MYNAGVVIRDRRIGALFSIPKTDWLPGFGEHYFGRFGRQVGRQVKLSLAGLCKITASDYVIFHPDIGLPDFS
jgi:hypothetical protein